MVVENRNLAVGTVLTVTYKKAQHRCLVVKTDKGLGFELASGEIYASPSSAGKAITGRISCDGWKFWSVADGTPPSALSAPDAASEDIDDRPSKPSTGSGPKLLRNIRKMPNQKGVPEGSTKFWCSACMKGFVIESNDTPDSCPEGHAKEMADQFAATPKEAAETE